MLLSREMWGAELGIIPGIFSARLCFSCVFLASGHIRLCCSTLTLQRLENMEGILANLVCGEICTQVSPAWLCHCPPASPCALPGISPASSPAAGMGSQFITEALPKGL